MGSDLYRVKVAEKQNRTVKLRVEVVHPDANYLSNNESFALMLLHEGTRGAEKAPLAQEISFEDTLDRSWLELYTRGFIERVEDTIESGSGEGDSPEQWLKGVLTITATDPAWIAHLEVGSEFDSRAFDAASSFNDCAPIRPGQVDPNAPVPEAFVPAPGALWEGSGLPTVVRVAAYSPSAYRSPKLRKGTFNAGDLKDLDGQVVVYQGPYDESPRVAHLSLQGESIRLFTASDGGFGSSASSPFEGSIGLAELIPGKRLGSKLRVSSLLSSLKPELRSASVEGDVASFRIAVPPGNDGFASLSADQAPALGFQLLLKPLMPTDDFATQKLLQPSALSWTVEREVMRLFSPEERQITQYIDGQMVPAGDTLPEISGLASRLARAFVAKTELASGPAVAVTQLDSLTEARQREVLSAPWPELVVKVTPHHAVYLQHLGKPLPVSSLPQYFGDAAPWEGAPPAPATGPTGFGRSAAPAAAVSSGSGPSSGAAGGVAANKVFKFAGIGCGVLVGLMLLCLLGGALVGK